MAPKPAPHKYIDNACLVHEPWMSVMMDSFDQEVLPPRSCRLKRPCKLGCVAHAVWAAVSHVMWATVSILCVCVWGGIDAGNNVGLGA